MRKSPARMRPMLRIGRNSRKKLKVTKDREDEHSPGPTCDNISPDSNSSDEVHSESLAVTSIHCGQINDDILYASGHSKSSIPTKSSKRRLLNKPKISFASKDDSTSTSAEDCDEDEDEIKNLDRLGMRIDGFECYVLIGLWVSTSCFGDLLVGDFRNRKGALPQLLRDSTVVFGLLVCLCGLYSTVVFATTILYGKTAVGLNRDVRFFTFMQDTAPQRSRAFRYLQYSTMSYVFLVCLVAMNELPSSYYVPLAMMVLGYLIYRGAADVLYILKSASPIYATPVEEEEEEMELIHSSASSIDFSSNHDMRKSLMTRARALDSVHFNPRATKRRGSIASTEGSGSAIKGRGLDSIYLSKSFKQKPSALMKSD
mmetsp:Transcript_12310/g.18894  ORF Transcript_12310/g.18894 Transcript_12310/m.18894 type:complete len:371 (-) Transcript_12310:129-1241(-)